MSFSELPDPEIEPASPTLAGRLFTAESLGSLLVLSYISLFFKFSLPFFLVIIYTLKTTSNTYFKIKCKEEDHI